MNNEKIVLENSIWDLHLHTCKCPKGSSEFSKMEVKDYIKQLLSITKKHKNLKLISFTDHNVINYDIYECLATEKRRPNFIVGVEVDTYLEEITESDKYKHLIFYFDIDNYEKLVENKIKIDEINEYLHNAPVQLGNFLSFLMSQRIRFVISPHAFKQEKRSINYEWSEETSTEIYSKKYSDQFFCFWEASGASEIARAQEFLRDFLLDNRVSIVSFSDANEFCKFEKYLSNPPQFFRSLPTFKGLQMVASDNKRISETYEMIETEDSGNYIGKIVFCGNQICCSNRMNAIIGGRGSGKSVLLDSIAYAINNNSVVLDKQRKKFIEKMPIEIYNYSGEKIKPNTMTFDYFHQSYVNHLFDNDLEYDKNLLNFFKSDFNKVNEIDYEDIFNVYKNDFDKLIEEESGEYEELSNISSLVSKYKILKDEKIKITWTRPNSKVKNLDYAEQLKKINNSLLKSIPEEVFDNEIEKKIAEFETFLLNKIHSYNSINYYPKMLEMELYKNLKKYKESVSKASRSKSELESLIITHFDEYTEPVIKRIKIINAYLKMNNSIIGHVENSSVSSSSESHGNKDRFIFKKELDIEKPVQYLQRVFKEFFFVKNNKDLKTSINSYCFDSNKPLKEGKTIEELDNALKEFNLNQSYHMEVYYYDNNYENIRTMSPGTQTNVLMEYLVNKDTTIPLLIDQPEDNVDNKTIFDLLTVWFRTLKTKRQVIVVTHDANIVINGDAENVIIAKKLNQNEFEYKNGALEYGNNLDEASIILDGGKTAIKRRILKYGE